MHMSIRVFRRGVGDMGDLRGELNMPLWTQFMNPTKGFWLKMSRSDPHRHWCWNQTFLLSSLLLDKN